MSKNFFYSARTEAIHNLIKKHIAMAPHIIDIHIRKADFDKLQATVFYPWMKNTRVLEYEEGYRIKAEP